MTRCEYCGRPIRHFEAATGIKHGVIRSYPEDFQPSRDSAWTVICASCGEKMLRTIYSARGRTKKLAHAPD